MGVPTFPGSFVGLKLQALAFPDNTKPFSTLLNKMFGSAGQNAYIYRGDINLNLGSLVLTCTQIFYQMLEPLDQMVYQSLKQKRNKWSLRLPPYFGTKPYSAEWTSPILETTTTSQGCQLTIGAPAWFQTPTPRDFLAHAIPAASHGQLMASCIKTDLILTQRQHTLQTPKKHIKWTSVLTE